MTRLEMGRALSVMKPFRRRVDFGICIDWFGLMVCGVEVAEVAQGGRCVYH